MQENSEPVVLLGKIPTDAIGNLAKEHLKRKSAAQEDSGVFSAEAFYASNAIKDERTTDVCSIKRSKQSSIAGMAAGGQYAENSLIQQIAFEEELHPHVLQFMTERRRGTSCPVVVDYGAADGETVGKLLQKFKEMSLNFTAVLQDLPTNDWGAASEILEQLQVGQLQPSHRLSEVLAASGSPRQSVVSCAGSFFEQVMPDNSVDLSISGSAYHWLSSTDGLPRPSGICLDLAKFPESMRQEWAERARADWATILRHRCAELRAGGMLMAIIPCAPCIPLALHLLEACFQDFDRRGLLRAEAKVLNGFVLPMFIHRTAQDLSDGFLGLPMKVRLCEVRPRRNAYMPAGGFAEPSDRQRFGQRMAGWCFGWAAGIIEDGVGSDNSDDFRRCLAESFAVHAHSSEMCIGMGCGIVLAERI
eukprot:TRINITY_DN27277_c0_g1_i1.p1 TRINITY_DN27277_c0_g1~~TRINITY_DN27277_c0_g1_i1.p1  ORF type:complete len:455 (+),score=92.59 TRINITY_DN27277_c0_g1_i1:112-1365(+)